MARQQVGFIGIGSMGKGMSLCLLKAGYPVTVCDPDADATSALKDAGAVVAQTPKEVADRAEVIFVCLPSPKVSVEVALGKNGVIEGKATKIFVDTSTIGREYAEKLAKGLNAKNIGFVDAPVSGGPDGAKAGKLSTIISGPQAHCDTIQPMIAAYATEIFHVGEQPGDAQVAKLINNLLSCSAKAITFEGIVLGLKAGLDPEKLVSFINVSTGRNMATLEDFPDRVLRILRGTGPTSIGIKDTELFLEEAERLGTPTEYAKKLLEIQREDGAYGLRARAEKPIKDYVDTLIEMDKKRRTRS
jgi:3-hydroxyisobutyrate dehydrogenase-like beta-hydroxyacid dehydrogenase